MKKFPATLWILGAALVGSLAACGKIGVTGMVDQAMGNWAQVKLPDGCVPRQIAAEANSGVAVLCKDGRVFH
jgi:hypothetical protein